MGASVRVVDVVPVPNCPKALVPKHQMSRCVFTAHTWLGPTSAWFHEM